MILLVIGGFYKKCYCCTLTVSTIAILLICLIGRPIAIAADIRHKRTINSNELTGMLQSIPHLSVIKNRNIILLRGSPKTHPTMHPNTA